MEDKETLGYIAGIIDSRGSIFIRSHKRKGLANYSLAMSIYHSNRNLLEFIQKSFGGKIYPLQRGYNLNFSAQDAYRILRSVFPYLIVKTAEAELAIEFQKSKEDGYEYPLSDEERERRKRYYLRMKELKRK